MKPTEVVSVMGQPSLRTLFQYERFQKLFGGILRKVFAVGLLGDHSLPPDTLGTKWR
jgi:hypothetical protein